MSTKAELEAENARLHEELAAAQSGRPSRPVPVAPSFGMCEGVRADLEATGKTRDPFTGKTVVLDGDGNMVFDDDVPADVADDAPAPVTEGE